MKKLTTIIAVTLILCGTLTAAAQPKFLSFGVKAGLNFADSDQFLTQVKDGSVTSRTDFVGGAFVEIKTPLSLSVTGEILYSGQGYKSSGHLDNGNSFNTDVKLSYINVPVTVNYYIIGGLAVKTGVQFGMNISKNAKMTDSSGKEVDLNDAFSTTDLAIPVGASYSFGFGLVVDARYNFGVKDISAQSILGDVVIGKSKNKVFTVTLGYRF